VAAPSALTLAAFCGSTRRGSLNRRLLHATVERCLNAGASVDVIDLGEVDLPLFNQDLEKERGIPADVAPIQARLDVVDGVLIASPEYNGGYTPLFKNTLDWISRIDHLTFYPRYVGLMTATPGGKGGARGLAQMEQLFHNVFVHVHEPSFGLGNAHEELDGGRPVAGLTEWTEEYLEAAVEFAKAPPEKPR